LSDVEVETILEQRDYEAAAAVLSACARLAAEGDDVGDSSRAAVTRYQRAHEALAAKFSD
jgi:hypothetical protein